MGHASRTGTWRVGQESRDGGAEEDPALEHVGHSEPISMQAIILAGGKGTRLRPFTNVFPKPLMPLGEADPMPIIEVVLRQLGRAGFGDVAVITGYLTELIEAFCGDGRKYGTRLTYER